MRRIRKKKGASRAPPHYWSDHFPAGKGGLHQDTSENQGVEFTNGKRPGVRLKGARGALKG